MSFVPWTPDPGLSERRGLSAILPGERLLHRGQSIEIEEGTWIST